MKKLASLILALTLCAGLCVPALAADFSDVPAGHNFYDAISYCVEKGIAGGYNDGTFRPGNTVTKNNFAVMLSRAFYADDVARYSTPDNLSQGAFVPNALALNARGVLSGVSFEHYYKDGSVMNEGINRYDMAILMTNIMNAHGFSAGSAEKSAASGKIADYNSMPKDYREAVANVYALGIIGGFSDGTFGGWGTMNRGQAAVVIYRMMQYSGGAEQPDPDPEPKPSVDPVPVTPDEPEPAPVTSAGGTLANGKAITEANVTEILTSLQTRYPVGTDFAQGYAGLGSGRTASNNCIAQITKNYTANNGSQIGPVSTTHGCGGWAAFVADEIFGQTGVTWKKTTLANARPGDILIRLDSAGYASHVTVYVSSVSDTKIRLTSASDSSTGYHIGWANSSASTYTYDVYTAYGD